MEKFSQVGAGAAGAGADSVMLDMVGSVYPVVAEELVVFVVVLTLWLAEELVEALEIDGWDEAVYWGVGKESGVGAAGVVLADMVDGASVLAGRLRAFLSRTQITFRTLNAAFAIALRSPMVSKRSMPHWKCWRTSSRDWQ